MPHFIFLRTIVTPVIASLVNYRNRSFGERKTRKSEKLMTKLVENRGGLIRESITKKIVTRKENTTRPTKIGTLSLIKRGKKSTQRRLRLAQSLLTPSPQVSLFVSPA